MPKSTNDKQGEEIAGAIIELLHSNKEKTWNLAQICQVVEKQLKLSGPTQVTLVLNGLIASKTIHGAANTWARYKDPNAPRGFGEKKWEPEVNEKEEKLKKEVEDLKKLVTTYQNTIDTKEKTIKELEEKIISSQKQSIDLLSQLKESLEHTRIVAVQVKKNEKVERTIEGLYHNQFERILTLAQARMNIFIFGPTGTGKTHISRQVADALDLRFGFISCTAGMGEATLGGRLLPIGKQGVFEYVPSEFVDFYENGGVYLLDELDAADPNVMLLINAALANGWITVSNRHKKVRAEMHPDFVCIAAGNTIGTGADRMYSARNKLDASTMDRFSVGKVYMDYDRRLEEQLCPDQELREILWGYREKIQQNRMERAMSTRFLRDAYRMKSEHNYSLEEIDTAYFMGWREDEINKVRTVKLKPLGAATINLKIDEGPARESWEKAWNSDKMEAFKRRMAEAAGKKSK